MVPTTKLECLNVQTFECLNVKQIQSWHHPACSCAQTVQPVFCFPIKPWSWCSKRPSSNIWSKDNFKCIFFIVFSLNHNFIGKLNIMYQNTHNVNDINDKFRQHWEITDKIKFPTRVKRDKTFKCGWWWQPNLEDLCVWGWNGSRVFFCDSP